MMIKLYSLTGGLSNDLVSFFVKKKKQNKNIENQYILDEKKDNLLLNDLKENGYVLVKDFINTSQVDEILNEFSKIKGVYYQDEVSNKKFYNTNSPEQIKFEYLEEDILNSSILKKIIFKKKLLQFSRDYLNAEPVLDIIAMWWSSYSEAADKKAAQWWHFDMDRPKWIKFFIYLTDCNQQNGPHCIIKRTHKNFSVPWKIRKNGYSRISDDIINKNFLESDITEIIAKKGTLLIEDSRALHKGKKLEKGNRLMFQLQFSNSLFGGNYKKFTIDKKNFAFSKIKKDNPYTYQLFDYE